MNQKDIEFSHAPSPRFELFLGAVFVIVAILLHIQFMGRAVFGLNLGLIIAYFIWVFGAYNENRAKDKILSTFLVAIAVQCLHLLEEYLTWIIHKSGFYAQNRETEF